MAKNEEVGEEVGEEEGGERGEVGKWCGEVG